MNYKWMWHTFVCVFVGYWMGFTVRTLMYPLPQSVPPERYIDCRESNNLPVLVETTAEATAGTFRVTFAATNDAPHIREQVEYCVDIAIRPLEIGDPTSTAAALLFLGDAIELLSGEIKRMRTEMEQLAPIVTNSGLPSITLPYLPMPATNYNNLPNFPFVDSTPILL